METNGEDKSRLFLKERTSPQDIELQKWVELLNMSPTAQQSITLIVGGSIISGIAIGRGQYHRREGEQFVELRLKNGLSDEKETEDLKRKYDEEANKMEENVKQRYNDEEVGEEEWYDNLPHYIHLKDVHLPVGLGTGAAPDFMQLRLKLSSVDGFSLVGMTAKVSFGG